MTLIPPIPQDAGPGSAGDAPPRSLAHAAKRLAHAHGFDLAGIAPVSLGKAFGRYLEWIRRGYAGEMKYLTRRPEVRADLQRLWPGARSALVTAMRYNPEERPVETAAGGGVTGRLARYAHGGDYHKFIKKRLLRVLRELQEIDPGIEGRTYVDTGPILERDLAAQAGIGWQGKNSLLLNRHLGSYFFLGTLLLNRRLPADTPAEEHCGTCTRCIGACPTGAIIAPGVVDARRCIAYLTIELRGAMPRALRPLAGNLFFGCDICQEVCPWNEEAPVAVEPRFDPRPGARTPDLAELMSLDEAAFRKRFGGTALMRARYDGFLRNVAVALGNAGGEESVPVLARALYHPELLARGHAAWALGRIGARTGSPEARLALEGRLYAGIDEWVREEVELALGELSPALIPSAGGGPLG